MLELGFTQCVQDDQTTILIPTNVLLKGCKGKKRQKQKPERRKKKVINYKFFNTSRLLLFLLLLKGRCQINHISIGPLQRINSNFLKSILAAFTWVSPAPLILECPIFTTTQLFQNKNNVTNHDDGKVINHTKNVDVKLFFSPSLHLDTLTKHSNLCLIYTNTLIWLLQSTKQQVTLTTLKASRIEYKFQFGNNVTDTGSKYVIIAAAESLALKNEIMR